MSFGAGILLPQRYAARNGEGGFSPLSLFQSAEPGVWYDPSDLSTMYQRSATNLVTPAEIGVPVSLMLDKSRGLARGPQLIVNGDFSAGTTSWTAGVSTLSTSGGRLLITATGTYGRAEQSFTTVIGDVYEFSASFERGTAALAYMSPASGTDYTSSATSGSISFVFTATSTSTLISIGIFAGAAGDTVFWDNVSVRRIAGTHAAQTTLSARPTLGRHPVTGIRNLMTQTSVFNNAAWIKTNTAVTANSVTAPDGTTTADTVTANASAGSGQQVYQQLTTLGSGSYEYSIYAKQGSGATDSNLFGVRNQTTAVNYAILSIDYSTGVITQTAGFGATATSVGNGWWRIAIPFTVSATVGDQIRFYAGSTGGVETPNEFAYFWGAQLETFTGENVSLTGGELRGNGVTGVVGTSTAATYSTTTGAGSVFRTDLSNQSYVAWSSLSGVYRLVISCATGSVVVRKGAGGPAGDIVATIPAGTTQTVYAPADFGLITIASASGVAASTFTLSSIQRLNLGSELQSSGVTGLIGSATAATYNTSTGAASVTRGIDAANQSFVQWGSLSGIYRIDITVATGSVIARITGDATTSPAGGIGTVVFPGATRTIYMNGLNGFITFTSSSGTSTFTINSIRLINNPIPTAHQNVNVVFDITEEGVADRYYLSHDGTDDFLLTGTITPSTDKSQVFAGVFKASDTLRGAVFGTSTAPNSNNGAVELLAPALDATSDYRFVSRGTASSTATAITVAPSTDVLAGLADIAGDISTIRVDRVETIATTDQGTGNFLAYPAYIGRRAGAALPFNGRLYSLIARFGPNLTTEQINNTETWVNGKTGGY